MALRASPRFYSRVDAALNGGRTGISQAHGRPGFVPYVASWCPEVVVFPVDPISSRSDVPIGVPMALMSDYPFQIISYFKFPYLNIGFSI
ncbi:hypothetical protein TorRG33x02_184220 [Trema orientale]|uniref:Uncharacterized protein n=1 Tax=Trema orientale TaxID=63057 RepID=A0A2P5EJX6_TREOI|nr:hypothetical protein TorRG33x02_184220 [Trema orientale]